MPRIMIKGGVWRNTEVKGQFDYFPIQFLIFPDFPIHELILNFLG